MLNKYLPNKWISEYTLPTYINQINTVTIIWERNKMKILYNKLYIFKNINTPSINFRRHDEVDGYT